MRFALSTPKLEWQDDAPIDTSSGDVYFSMAGGLEETQHVFLSGNYLPMRWKNYPNDYFVIVETGFGSGLNFLAVWQAFRSAKQAGECPHIKRLHFVSIERAPFTAAQMQQAHRPFTQLAPLAAQLRAKLPPAISGLHRLTFDDGAVVLTLAYGPADAMLPELALTADAWFLDGFAPAKNPDMWNDALFAEMKRLSAPGTTVATFTAAGIVKRGLASAGFEVRKQPGFGRKRDMLAAAIPGEFSRPRPPENIQIIGAGIAGITIAHQLTRRGITCQLIDARSGPALNASGNPAAAMLPYLTADASPRGRFFLQAYCYTRHWLDEIAPKLWHDCGGLMLAADDARMAKYAKYLALPLPEGFIRQVTASEASDHAGRTLPFGGLWYAHAGWFSMPALCQQLLQNLSVDNQWNQPVQNAQGLTILTHGWAMPKLNLAGFAPKLEAVRGQLITLPESTTPPACVVNYGNYATPAQHGRWVIGSSYGRHDTTLESRESESQMIWNGWQQLTGGSSTLPADTKPFTAIRCAAHDRMPIIGAINAQTYASLAHGSRGAMAAPFAAEIIACQLTGEPLPIERSLLKSISPTRYVR